MTTPVAVSFKQLPGSDAVLEPVRRRADELEKRCERTLLCRVVVRSHRHGRNGARYSVGDEVRVPGEQRAVGRVHRSVHAPPHEDPSIAARGAFDVMRRQLQDCTRHRGGQDTSRRR